jgi:CheY-like chemotaxis protein
MTVPPTAEAEGSFGRKASGEDADASAPVARVLIVDDREVNLRLCSAFCDLFHFECESVRSGPEALEALRQAHFDVVLMDIHMPGMSGVEATRAIRDLPAPMNQIPVIAVTSDAGLAQARTYLAGGMAAVVSKPITPARLFKAIEAALDRPAAEPRSWAFAEAG